MIPRQCIEVQTSAVDRPSVPPWLAEVTILAQHLATKGLLEAFTHQIRLVRGHFGYYEPIDFLVLLLGYAISGERTLADFFERLSPFGPAFMALFGRANLPHRSSLSRLPLRRGSPLREIPFVRFSSSSAFQKDGPRKPLGESLIDKDAVTLSLMWMRHARQRDNVHYLAIRCFLLHAAASMPSVRRVTSGGSGVRWYEHVPQRGPLHTRQWIGTYGDRGNGDYQAELATALQAIKTYLAHFALTTQTALVRLDGQYGDAVVIAQRDFGRSLPDHAGANVSDA